MNAITKIRLDESLNPETRVYLIANYLNDIGQINSDLFYAILDLKDKHLRDIQIPYDIEYFKD